MRRPGEIFRVARKTFYGFDRRVWLLVGAMLALRFGQGLYYPFSTIYFHNVVGISLPLIGVGLAGLAAASVASGLISGPLTDRYGRKPVMLLALGGSACTFLAFSFVESFAGYLITSVAAGFAGASMFDASRNAMVADVTASGRRSRAYGLVRVGGNVGWALGPMTAGVASGMAGGSGEVYRTLFVGTAALALAVMLALALLARESLPQNRESKSAVPGSHLREALSNKSFALLLGAGILMYYIFTQDWQALPIYAKNFAGIRDSGIGMILGANGVVVILLQLPISYLIDRSSKAVALLAGAALFAASSVTLLVSDAFFGILLAFAGFFTLAEMVLEVAGAALAAELAPVRLRGTYLALFGVCFGIGYGISPVVAGSLLGAGVPHVIWLLQLAAAGLAASALTLLMLRQRSRG